MNKRTKFFKVNKLENIEIVQDGKTYVPVRSLVIFHTDKQFAIWDNDGVGQLMDINEKAEICFNEIDKVSFIPSMVGSPTFENFKEHIGEEIDSREAVRVFGSRLEVNYNIMLKTAREMGIEILEDSQVLS